MPPATKRARGQRTLARIDVATIAPATPRTWRSIVQPPPLPVVRVG